MRKEMAKKRREIDVASDLNRRIYGIRWRIERGRLTPSPLLEDHHAIRNSICNKSPGESVALWRSLNGYSKENVMPHPTNKFGRMALEYETAAISTLLTYGNSTRNLDGRLRASHGLEVGNLAAATGSSRAGRVLGQQHDGLEDSQDLNLPKVIFRVPVFEKGGRMVEILELPSRSQILKYAQKTYGRRDAQYLDAISRQEGKNMQSEPGWIPEYLEKAAAKDPRHLELIWDYAAYVTRVWMYLETTLLKPKDTLHHLWSLDPNDGKRTLAAIPKFILKAAIQIPRVQKLAWLPSEMQLQEMDRLGKSVGFESLPKRLRAISQHEIDEFRRGFTMIPLPRVFKDDVMELMPKDGCPMLCAFKIGPESVAIELPGVRRMDARRLAGKGLGISPSDIRLSDALVQESYLNSGACVELSVDFDWLQKNISGLVQAYDLYIGTYVLPGFGRENMADDARKGPYFDASIKGPEKLIPSSATVQAESVRKAWKRSRAQYPPKEETAQPARAGPPLA